MKEEPLVTVIIPTFNRAKYIERSINSVLSQSYKNIELIIVDDGSTDNTAEIVAKFTNVRYVYQSNKRQANARNTGLDLSNGEYLATLDSDDFWNEDFLKDSIEQLTTYNYDFVFSNYALEVENGKKYDGLESTNWLKIYFNSEEFNDKNWIQLNSTQARNLFTKTCPAPSSGLVFNKKSIKHRWDEHIDVADDWDFVITLLLSKNCFTAFSKRKLWIKHDVGNNLYESLNHAQKINIVIYKDLKYISRKNKNKFSKSEKLNIKSMQVADLLSLSFHRLHYKYYKQFLILFGKSFKVSTSLTLKLLINKYLIPFLSKK